jgi:hypothetical protein
MFNQFNKAKNSDKNRIMIRKDVSPGLFFGELEHFLVLFVKGFGCSDNQFKPNPIARLNNIITITNRNNARGIPSPGALEFIVDLTVRVVILKGDLLIKGMSDTVLFVSK